MCVLSRTRSTEISAAIANTGQRAKFYFCVVNYQIVPAELRLRFACACFAPFSVERVGQDVNTVCVELEPGDTRHRVRRQLGIKVGE